LTPDIDTYTFGGNCPVQATGEASGAWWYFRARGRHWSVEVWTTARPVGDGLPDEDPDWTIEGCYGDEPYLAGWMPDDEAHALIRWALEQWAAGGPGGVLVPEGPPTLEQVEERRRWAELLAMAVQP
jgi:hypothetical protein